MADESRRKKDDIAGRGSGLGFAIVRQILGLHGAKYGNIGDANGTTMYIELSDN